MIEVSNLLELKQKSPEEFASEILVHLRKKSEDKVIGEMFQHLLFWKINVSQINMNDVDAYIKQVQDALAPEFDKFDCVVLYMPVFDEPTSLTIVDVKAMTSIKI